MTHLDMDMIRKAHPVNIVHAHGDKLMHIEGTVINGEYPKGVPVSRILSDSWAFGHSPSVAVKEAHAQGYTWVMPSMVEEYWRRLDNQMERYLS